MRRAAAKTLARRARAPPSQASVPPRGGAGTRAGVQRVVRRGAAARLRQGFLRENSAPGAKKAVEAALARGRAADFGLITEEALVQLAAAVGTGEFRTHAGAPFHGKSAPAPAKIPELLEELLE